MGVDLYFIRGSSALSQVVTIDLSGCRGIGAPGRQSRSLSAPVAADLKSLAPPAWVQYFQ